MFTQELYQCFRDFFSKEKARPIGSLQAQGNIYTSITFYIISCSILSHSQNLSILVNSFISLRNVLPITR